jgi:N-methylhydantoinase A
MIEIGAGGGSLARTDAMGRIQTGPESAGSEPGPACYQRGGERPTITDADLVLGKLDPDNFAGGAIVLSHDLASAAIEREIGDKLGLPALSAAFGIGEVVDENMANAARVHAVENGKDISANVMIAFGGAAPLHAARLCEKLGIERCIVPPGAGVGSAIGFLRAPVGYEALASKVLRLSSFDTTAVNAMLDELKATAEGFVRASAKGPVRREITAFMRYVGQGWEIPVSLPDRAFTGDDAAMLKSRFREGYARFFGRAIDGLDSMEIEIVTWSVKAVEETPPPPSFAIDHKAAWLPPAKTRPVFDPARGEMLDTVIVERGDLLPGAGVRGPAVIVERETSTLVTSLFDAVMQADGSILLLRKEMAA